MVKKPLHIPSLIMGILAIASFWFTFGISGIVCGIIGMNLARKNRYEYKSSAGFVLSLISVIISIIILTIFLTCFLILKLMPDSIGAYYIQDLFEMFRDRMF